jgi:hypothetical protein
MAPRAMCTVLGLMIVGLALGAYAQDSADDDAQPVMKPLPIVLPKAMFMGTPKDIKTDNLEKITGKKRPPFLAPEGAINVAFEKRVSASDEDPIIGEIEMITDGDKEAPEGSFVEFGWGPQWVQIDLGEVSEIYAILVWHYHAEARVYRDVIVRLSDDEDFISNVRTVFNNDHDNSSGLGVGKEKEYIETDEGKLFDAKSAKSRYVRLYSNGSTSSDVNHCIEVEVWGKPVG